ncbi:hypothetical protein LKF67_1297 [Lactococcus lactis subsp. lactis]|uniref:hypothetical protein n=1 Tax=Lactococcus lactis TaxID=1358 RepID=UPI0007278BA1|nr:hypothetical protein [Lactococcus lactis]KST91709.1 hypothetical protein LKF67_1297 [Lactococcus lactis subsp. lactis]
MNSVRSLVINDTGFTLSDLLNNDYSTILSLVTSQETKEKEEPVSLADFISSI